MMHALMGATKMALRRPTLNMSMLNKMPMAVTMRPFSLYRPAIFRPTMLLNPMIGF